MTSNFNPPPFRPLCIFHVWLETYYACSFQTVVLKVKIIDDSYLKFLYIVYFDKIPDNIDNFLLFSELLNFAVFAVVVFVYN